MNETLKFLLDEYRLGLTDIIEIPNAGRDTLADVIHKLDFKKGVEVGVEQGYYSEVLARANPQMTIFGVDPYGTYMTHVADPDRGKEANHITQERSEEFFKEAQELLKDYPNYHFVRKTSMDAAQDFEDGSLDFVYLDAYKEYSNVYQDITQWHKKIRSGGILAGHDYYRFADKRALMHTRAAVDDYVKKNNIKPLIIWGTNAIIPGMIRDKYRSWSWVVE